MKDSATNKNARIALQTGATVLAATLAWGTLIERQMFTVRHLSIPILKNTTGSLRILQFSDLHLAPWQTRKIRWVRSLAKLAPDLVVSTGDQMGHKQAFEALKHTFEPFAHIPGVFVHGSNDYYEPTIKNPLKYLSAPSTKPQHTEKLNIEQLNKFYENDLGWLSLNNSATNMSILGNNYEFFGVDDPHIFYDKPQEMLKSLDLLRTASASSEPNRIAVVHAPYTKTLNLFVEQGANLIIAGHTHGGQVRIPGVGALTTNCDIPREYARGLSDWTHKGSSAKLNVSAGLGHSIYAPVRFACRPEVSLITLTPEL